jgi:hypothetical protein
MKNDHLYVLNIYVYLRDHFLPFTDGFGLTNSDSL